MEIKRTEMKVSQGDKFMPINLQNENEEKKLITNNERFKTVCFNFEPGKGLPSHIHNSYATILIYEGEVDMEFEDGQKFNLKQGDYMPFDARVRHKVIAVIKSKVLVTIGASLS